MVQEYKRKRDDLSDLALLEHEEIMKRADMPLRVGAMSCSKRSKNGRNTFHGSICHVAVYLRAISFDTIRAHHFAGVQSTAPESDRLFALARAKFQAALAMAPDDLEIILRYAQSITNSLDLDFMQVRPTFKLMHSMISSLV